jgi:phosphoribosylaminoimidazolecarboxamide formyltransferase / IMP cyclohydrolase
MHGAGASEGAPAGAGRETAAGTRPIRRALVSVWDKAGLGDLATALHAHGVEMVSTGSTAGAIRQLGLPVTAVEEVTGAPEMLDGRVKTLHPRIHAGILADQRLPEHLAQLDQHRIEPFDLVVCNLYPFERAVANPATTPDQAIEQIDVGGPTMLRAAAKNHAAVAVVCDPDDYPVIEAALAAGGTTLAQRQALAATAFARTAAYDAAIADWFAGRRVEGEAGAERAGAERAGAAERQGAAELPETIVLTGRRVQALRYGENPHQRAAFYRLGPEGAAWGLAGARQLGGKELSYNNLLDTDAALGVAREFAAAGRVPGDQLSGRPFAVIVKHTNPCGAATGATLEEAYAGAFEGDPVSAFGGVVALTRPLDAATAARIAEVFTEVVAAPGFEPEALDLLAGKKSLRLLQVGLGAPGSWLALRSVAGGVLVQDADHPTAVPAAWRRVAGPEPDAGTLVDLDLAWRVTRHVKSNAIVLANGGRIVGVGAGQMSRVESARIAVAKAGERVRGAVAGSDAFFPFPDGVETLAEAGVRAIVHPGGSVRDAEVNEAAEAAGVTLLHTGFRHFRH